MDPLHWNVHGDLLLSRSSVFLNPDGLHYTQTWTTTPTRLFSRGDICAQTVSKIRIWGDELMLDLWSATTLFLEKEKPFFSHSNSVFFIPSAIGNVSSHESACKREISFRHAQRRACQGKRDTVITRGVFFLPDHLVIYTRPALMHNALQRNKHGSAKHVLLLRGREKRVVMGTRKLHPREYCRNPHPKNLLEAKKASQNTAQTHLSGDVGVCLEYWKKCVQKNYRYMLFLWH